MKWLVLSLLGAHIALGAPVGNGGDAVLCRGGDGSLKSIEFFDFFEARALNKDPLEYPDGRDVHEIFAAMLQRLARVAPRRAERYAEQAEEFFARALFLPETRLIDVPDYDATLLPPGCNVEQVVIQQVPALPEDRRFIVSKDLWDLLGEADKAGLLMHQMIMQDALTPQRFSFANQPPFAELVYVDSRKVRALNQIVWAGNFAHKDALAFLRILGELHFQRAEYAGIEITLFDYVSEDYKYLALRPAGEGVERPSYTLYPGTQQMEKARAFPGSTLRLGDAQPKVVGWLQFYPSGQLQNFGPCSDFRLSAWPGPALDVAARLPDSCQFSWSSDEHVDRQVSLYENASPKRLYAKANDLRLSSATYDFVVNGAKGSGGAAALEFTPDARLLSVWGEIRGSATRSNKRVNVSGEMLELYPTGLLKRVRAKEYFVESMQGKELRFFSDTHFYEGGQLWKSRLAQPARLKTVHGEVKTYQRGNVMEFDAAGLVIGGK